jgi:hypothetical protein
MSEEKATYQIVGDDRLTLKEMKTWPSARLYTDPRYVQPSPEQLKQLQLFAGWSQTDVASLAGVVFDPDKGSSTVRRWRAPVKNSQHRDISYAAWRLLLIHAGVVTAPLSVPSFKRAMQTLELSEEAVDVVGRFLPEHHTA